MYVCRCRTPKARASSGHSSPPWHVSLQLQSYSFQFSLLTRTFWPHPDAGMLVLFPPNDVFPKSQSIFSAGSSPGNIASSPPLPFLGNNLHPPSHLILINFHPNPFQSFQGGLGGFLCDEPDPGCPFWRVLQGEGQGYEQGCVSEKQDEGADGRGHEGLPWLACPCWRDWPWKLQVSPLARQQLKKKSKHFQACASSLWN